MNRAAENENPRRGLINRLEPTSPSVHSYALRPSREGIIWIDGALVVWQRDNPPFANGEKVQWRGYHDAVKRCYEIFLENQAGYMKIDARFNAEGNRFRDSYGVPRPFLKDDIRRMVWANRIYAGYTPIGRAKNGASQIVKGNHSEILPVEICDHVNEVLSQRHSAFVRGGGGRPKHAYLFRNLYCADCGVRLVGQFRRRKRQYRHYDSSKRCPRH